MQRYNVLVLMILAVSIVIGQNTNLKPSDYDEIYPLYFNAMEAALDGEFEDAMPIFNKMLAKYPGHQEAYFLREICNDAIHTKISVNAAQYFFEAVYARYNSGTNNQIIFLFNQAFKEEDSYYPFYMIRGSFFSSINNFDLALSDFNMAIQLQPNVAVSYYNRGKLYQTYKFNVQALSDFNKTIELNSSYSAAYIKRASIFYEMSQDDRTLADMLQACKIDSTSIKSLKNSSLLNNLGTTYFEKNNLNKALQSLNLAVKADDRWYEPFLNRGIVYKYQNQYDLALNDFNKAFELKPEIGKIYYNTGLMFQEQGKYDQARDYLVKSLDFEDTEVRVFFHLAKIYTEIKDFKSATEYYKKAIKLEPDHIWAYYQLGSLYDKRRGFLEAIMYYDEFVSRASDDYFDHKIKVKDRSDRIKKYLEKKNKK